jgi:hypothetical protein
MAQKNQTKKSLSQLEKRLERLRKRSKGPEAPLAERFYHNEIAPIIEFIKHNKGNYNEIAKSLRKYLVISCVSLAEDFLSHLIYRVIDENHIDIFSIVDVEKEDVNEKISKQQKNTNRIITKGEYVAANNNFANAEAINSVFTKLLSTDKEFQKLNIDFFEAVKRIDDFDPYKYVKRARRISLNWNNFILMFELRTDVVHEMKEINMPDSKLFSLCDNTMNFLEASIFICEPQFRKDVIERLQTTMTDEKAIA